MGRAIPRAERLVRIPLDPFVLIGSLAVPPGARALVLVAQGTGSSRLSTRSRRLAQKLREGDIATLLLDLVTPEEQSRFGPPPPEPGRKDIDLLAGRLIVATDWARGEPETRELGIGYLGVGTGAAVALAAAAERPFAVGAIACRDGTPDLAGPALAGVKAPTVFIVSEGDEDLLDRNREAESWLRGAPTAVEIVRARGNLDEGAVQDTVARLAIDWFGRYF